MTKKPNIAGRIKNQYVFTGYYISEKRTDLLEPVPDIFLLSDSLISKKNKESRKLVPWKTDKYGILRGVDKNFKRRATGVLKKEREFIMPPLEIVSWAVSTALNSSYEKSDDFKWKMYA